MNFLETLACWYAYQIMFLFLILMISSNSRITAATSLLFQTFLAFTSISLFLCHSPVIIESSSSFSFDFLNFLLVSGIFLKL